jgi:hypothetical protein
VAALPETDPAPSRAILARVLIAAVAILLIAWLVVLARNYSIAYDASRRIVDNPGMSAGEWRTTMHDFDRAHVLDPSSDWSLVQAQYELLRQPDAAIRRADAVLRTEPDNLAAWWVILRATQQRDPARYRQALIAVNRLNPTPGAP